MLYVNVVLAGIYQAPLVIVGIGACISVTPEELPVEYEPDTTYVVVPSDKYAEFD